MRSVVLVAAIGASAVLGGIVGGAVVRVIDKSRIALLHEERDRFATTVYQQSGVVVEVDDRLRLLERVVGGCACPKPR